MPVQETKDIAVKGTAAALSLRLVAAAVIGIVALVRIRLLGLPLGRDEGEYAYAGQLMLQGIPPFRLASNMKLPGTDAAYAAIMAVFGETAAGIHLGLLLANFGAAALLFLIGRRLFGAAAGWAAAASYLLLALGMPVAGMMGHAEQFVLVPALGATLLLLRWNDRRKVSTLFWSGLFFGVAVMMKQSGALFALFGTLYLLLELRPDRHLRAAAPALAVFALAGLLPLAVTCLGLWQEGVFPRFWFWTVDYARAYGTAVPFWSGVKVFSRTIGRIIGVDTALWLLAAAGLTLAWRGRSSGPDRAAALFTTSFLVFSFLAVCPGLYFRGHYFVYLLPAVALLVGAAVEILNEGNKGKMATGLFSAAAAVSVFLQSPYFFVADYTTLLRQAYAPNPFPEAPVIADYIAKHTGEADRIAVLGSDPEIYFEAKRHSATDYIYSYSLGEDQPLAGRMQDEMIRDIETAKPEYIVVINMPSSWLFLPGTPGCKPSGTKPPADCDIFGAANGLKEPGAIYYWNYDAHDWTIRHGAVTQIFDWFSVWGPQHYEVEGIADIGDLKTDTIYVWGAEAAAYKPRTSHFVRILKRKS